MSSLDQATLPFHRPHLRTHLQSEYHPRGILVYAMCFRDSPWEAVPGRTHPEARYSLCRSHSAIPLRSGLYDHQKRLPTIDPSKSLHGANRHQNILAAYCPNHCTGPALHSFLDRGSLSSSNSIAFSIETDHSHRHPSMHEDHQYHAEQNR